MNNTNGLAILKQQVNACRKCPRLVRYLRALKRSHHDWWCKPVPSFGDPKARILLIGLAPGRAGSNRTGRMFTGDASGTFLYRTLHELGLASRPLAVGPNDGLRLRSLYISAVVRCAPPQNKPTRAELHRCSSYITQELSLLPNIRVAVTLGKIAHEMSLRLLGLSLARYPFRHGAVYELKWQSPFQTLSHFATQPLFVVASYHPSRQNTQTGRLTKSMFRSVFIRAIRLANRHEAG